MLRDLLRRTQNDDPEIKRKTVKVQCTCMYTQCIGIKISDVHVQYNVHCANRTFALRREGGNEV